ncbi:MAG: hypothetical protein ABFD50_12535 [Smithella sp.]
MITIGGLLKSSSLNKINASHVGLDPTIRYYCKDCFLAGDCSTITWLQDCHSERK